jgi:hypothetical protein
VTGLATTGIVTGREETSANCSADCGTGSRAY